jgi:hypothetical protein
MVSRNPANNLDHEKASVLKLICCGCCALLRGTEPSSVHVTPVVFSKERRVWRFQLQRPKSCVCGKTGSTTTLWPGFIALHDPLARSLIKLVEAREAGLVKRHGRS